MSEFYESQIQVACDFLGWSCSELAARTGVSRTTISSVKYGSKVFTYELAQLLASACNLPISFFMLKDKILTEQQLTFRAPQRFSAIRKRQISVEYSLLAATTERLSRMSNTFPNSDWISKLAPHTNPTHAEIESIAQKTRVALNLSERGTIPNVLRAFERGGICVAPLSNVHDDFNRVDGVCNPEFNAVPTIAYSKQNSSGDRQRFTIAHEAGHLILQKYRRNVPLRIQEDEANYFAAAFLIPESDSQEMFSSNMNLMDFVHLKTQWGVSIASMITRAARLGIIDSNRQRSLMMQLSARNWRTCEPVIVDFEQPILLRQMVGNSLGNIIDSTHAQASPLNVEGFLGLPFDTISYWCDGLTRKKDSFNIDELQQNDQ